ncbi:hypothetical protein [Pseudomonas sp. TMW22089]|uniref:hypothetical protein n=1 Tax=Pseudomonas sp. TMW22089 TaxID=2506433 RepID=UPI001F0EB970|nr:hypothetical protein [Pseudomonas sp. TMW22089]MCH4870444.1 hypothetical protein [Pseudomonas sp. TMW22089]
MLRAGNILQHIEAVYAAVSGGVLPAAVRLSRHAGTSLSKGVIHRFEQSQSMPTLKVQHREPRFLLADKIAVNEENIEWQLPG